ncbi:MAG: hypothetical protein B0A82_21000 [Alkalinema sp. CACIAM 70d]|nr:MAG: hypothetical protein B0A82_21000 [Alkalinema sp. CACIAM 70d]
MVQNSSATATPPPPFQEQLSGQLQQATQKQAVPLMIIGSLLLGYAGVWLFRPQWLLKLPSTDLAVPFTSWKIPLALMRPLKYRDRALDAWVEQHWKIAQAEFFKLDTVVDRQIHIPLPVCKVQKPDSILFNDLSGSALVPTFQKNQRCW